MFGNEYVVRLVNQCIAKKDFQLLQAGQEKSIKENQYLKDVRTKHETSNVDGVMDGNLDEFIKSYLMEYGANN